MLKHHTVADHKIEGEQRLKCCTSVLIVDHRLLQVPSTQDHLLGVCSDLLTSDNSLVQQKCNILIS